MPDANWESEINLSTKNCSSGEGSDYNDYKVVFFLMKALQAQHTQNFMNVTMIVPSNAKKYICTPGLSFLLMNTQILLSCSTRDQRGDGKSH